VASGTEFETEIADFLTFDGDGRITELVEFADTGAISHMAAKGLL
jgi:ketosteroid isomerase-like protein